MTMPSFDAGATAYDRFMGPGGRLVMDVAALVGAATRR